MSFILYLCLGILGIVIALLAGVGLYAILFFLPLFRNRTNHPH